MSEPVLHVRKIACRGYVFDDFTLDLDRGCLWRAGQEIKLRHKSFEALKFLVERHGRLVTKEDGIRKKSLLCFLTFCVFCGELLSSCETTDSIVL